MLGCIWPTVCRPTISLANPSGEMGNGRGINHTRYLPQLAIKFIVQIIDDVGQYILDEISQRLVGFLVHPRQTSSLYRDRKSTRLNSSHVSISYAVFCLKKKTNN